MASLRIASTSTLRAACCSSAASNTTSSSILIARRKLHQRVPLPYELDQGLEPFLSPTALRTIAVDWQQGVLTRLNELVRDTEVEHLSVLQTIKQTASNPSQTMAFNYASEALNNSFFLSTLSPTPTRPSPSSSFSQALSRTPMRDFPGLISHFSAHVAGLHPSSASYIWLVTDQTGNLGVVGTYAGGTPLIHQRSQVGKLDSSRVLGETIPQEAADASTAEGASSTQPESDWETIKSSSSSSPKARRSSSTSNLLDLGGYSPSVTGDRIGKVIHPLACVATHPHCYMQDYGVWGREEYVKNWWGAVDWRKIEESFAGFVPKNR